MNESRKERGMRQFAEVKNRLERMKSEVVEAQNAANAADAHAASKREELVRVCAEVNEAEKAANAAREHSAAKRDEYEKQLAALVEEMRDKTKPLD
jgi:hypothetical protein